MTVIFFSCSMSVIRSLTFSGHACVCGVALWGEGEGGLKLIKTASAVTTCTAKTVGNDFGPVGY